jgi:hypothetical protein
VVGIDEDLVLDCYRLADFYHVNPEIFLDMPFGQVVMHLRNTIRLAEIKAEEARRD